MNSFLGSLYSISCTLLQMDGVWPVCTKGTGGWVLPAVIRRHSHVHSLLTFKISLSTFWLPHPSTFFFVCFVFFAAGHLFFLLSLNYDLILKTWANTSSIIRGLLPGGAACAPLWYFIHPSARLHSPYQRHCHGNLPPLGNKYWRQSPTYLICLMFYFSKHSLGKFKLSCRTK